MTTNTIKKMAAIAALIFGFGFASWAEQVTIGNLGSASQNASLPFNGTYNYSYSQQIYTAGEIGGAGVINSLTVWLVHTGSEALPTFNIDIYMKEVSKDAFSNTSDWVNVSSWDKVYTGTLTVANTTARAFTFTLDRSFVYSGQNNLLIAFDDNTGSWKSGLRGMVFGTAGTPARSIYALNDNTNFDPTSMSGVTAYTTSYQRNVIELGMYDQDLSNIHNITIGDPQSTSQITSLPWVGIYDYSYSQQIYTADEIGTSGTINAVTMWLVHTGSEALPTFNIDIYMKEVDKETFSGSSDWVSVSATDKVYSGSVKVTNTSAQAFTFTLATPFAYSGQGNLLIVFDDNTGSYKSGLRGIAFGTASDPYRAVYACRDGSDYDPFNMGGVTSSTLTRRNVVALSMTDCPALPGLNTVTIGDTESTAYHTVLPMTSTYNYTYSQQIFTAEEIGTVGTINTLTMWLRNNSTDILPTLVFDIYMREVDKDAFTSSTDWVSVSATDKVYSGTLTVTNSTFQSYTFTLDTPFEYSGEGNLLIVFDENTGYWKSGLQGKVSGTDSDPIRAIYARRDSSDYDPFNMGNVLGSGTTYQRNVVELGIDIPCPMPTNLAVSLNPSNGIEATLSWTGGSGTYNVEYKKATDVEWTSFITNTTQTTANLTSLQGGTNYEARVQSVCDDTNSDWVTIDFQTPCIPIAVTADAPYTQDFEDGVIPGCWDVYAPAGYYAPVVYDYSYSHSGSYSLRFRNGLSYAVLPEFDVPLNQLQIRFQMRKEITDIFFIDTKFYLGYITAEDDGTCNTFTAITTYNSNEYWGQQTTVLSALPLTAQRLVLKASLSSVACYIDDVEVAVFSGCYPVDSLNVSNLTDSSVSLSWGLMDTEQTVWDVQVATDADFTDIVAEYEADSHENYPISNLSSETHYYVRVKPTCGDDLWSNTIDFTTFPPCDGPITITPDAPYTEGFESPEGTAYNVSGPLPDCWAGYRENSGIAPHNTTGNFNHSGSQSLSFYKSGWAELFVDVYAILPEFSNPLNELQISFWMRAESSNGINRLGLGYITAEDNGTCNTFTAIEDYYYNNSWVQHAKVLYTLPATARRLVFLFSNLDVLHIDDLEVSVCNCFPVGPLTVNNATTNSASLSWELVDESQTEWAVQVATDADFTDIVAEYEADTHENFLIDGLSVNTTYYVRVRAVCDDTQQSEWSDAIFFSTLCEPITITTDAPYTQGFESPIGSSYFVAGPLPPCWEAYTTGTVAPHNTTGGATEVHGGTQSLSFNGESETDNYAILPEFSNPLNELQISFWMKNYDYGRLQLGYLTAEDEGNCNTFTAIADFGSTSTWTQYTAYLLNVPDTAQRLAFKFSESFMFRFIDDLEVSLAPDCYPVGNLSVDSLASTSVYLSWVLIDNSQEAWDVQVATDAAFTNTVAEYVADSHENYLLSGLSIATQYYVRVKPTCSEDLWSNTIDFTTLCGPYEITLETPYTQSFEDPEGTPCTQHGPLPPCWEGYNNTVNPAPHNTIGAASAPFCVHSGMQSLSFNNYDSGNAYAVLPEFSNSFDELQIRFWMRTDGTGSGQLQLGYLSAEDDGTCNTFTAIADFEDPYHAWIQHIVSLSNMPDAAQRLAFKWSGNDMIGFVDDLEVCINPCAPITVTADAPYTQDFEGVQGTTQNYWTYGQVPDCWEAHSTASYAPHVVSNQWINSTQTLEFYYHGNNYAVLPEFSTPLNQLQIGFKMRTGYLSSQSNYSGQLQLGYITAEDDNYSTFTAIAGYDNYTSLAQCNTVLENVPAEAWRLVFKWSATYMTCYIDDVEVSLNPNAIATQTVALSAGWNWFSSNVDITLDDLKAALVSTGNTTITIKSKSQNTYYQNNRWRGSLNFDVAQMYKIYVETGCEIAFEGMPINPSEHSITIHNGPNWIGFPLNESMSLANAFAGFAVNGDVIKSKSGSANYLNGQWRGAFNLMPGQGYIYKSNAAGDRILTFPTTAK